MPRIPKQRAWLDYPPVPKRSAETADDEGDFWETCGLHRLTGEIGEQSAILAGFLGALKDAMGQAPGAGTVEAPIAEYPNFEHLEAEGQRLLAGAIKDDAEGAGAVQPAQRGHALRSSKGQRRAVRMPGGLRRVFAGGAWFSLLPRSRQAYTGSETFRVPDLEPAN